MFNPKNQKIRLFTLLKLLKKRLNSGGQIPHNYSSLQNISPSINHQPVFEIRGNQKSTPSRRADEQSQIVPAPQNLIRWSIEAGFSQPSAPREYRTLSPPQNQHI